MREKAPLQPQSDMQSNPRDGTEKEPAAFTHFLLNLQIDSKDPRRAVELALERLASYIRLDSAPCHTFGPLWARGVFVHLAFKTSFFKKYSIGPAPHP